MQDFSPALSKVPFRNWGPLLHALEEAGAEDGPLEQARRFFADPSAARAANRKSGRKRRRAPPAAPSHLELADTPTCAALLSAVLRTVPPPADEEPGGPRATRAPAVADPQRLGSLLGASATCVPSRQPVIHASRVPQELAGLPGEEANGFVRRLVSVTVRAEFAADAAALVALAATVASPERPLPWAELLDAGREVLARFPWRALKGRFMVGVVLRPGPGDGKMTETAEASTPWMSPERVWAIASGAPESKPLPVFAGPAALELAPLATWLAGLLGAAHDPKRSLPHLSPDLTLELPSADVAASFLRGILVICPSGAGPAASPPGPAVAQDDLRLVFRMQHLEQGRQVNLRPAIEGLMARLSGCLEELRDTDLTTYDWLLCRVQHEIYKKLRSFDPALVTPLYLQAVAGQAFLGALYGGKLPSSYSRKEAAPHLPGLSRHGRASHVQARKITGTEIERLWKDEGVGRILPEQQALLRLLRGQSLHAYVITTLRSQLAALSREPSPEDGDPDLVEEDEPIDAGREAPFGDLGPLTGEDRRRRGAARAKAAAPAADYVPDGDVIQYCRDWQRFEWGYGGFAREAFPTELEELTRLASAQDLCQICLARLSARPSRTGVRRDDPADRHRVQETRVRALLEREGASRRLVDLNRAELKELAHALGLPVNRPATAVDAAFVAALLYPDSRVQGGRRGRGSRRRDR